MAQHDNFPGWPKPAKALVKRVRSVLWRYLRCRPQQLDAPWLLAWEWARCETLASDRFGFSRMRWPSANEIASQYLLLVLAKMRDESQLRLPFRAADAMPAAVRTALKIGSGKPVLSIPQLSS